MILTLDQIEQELQSRFAAPRLERYQLRPSGSERSVLENAEQNIGTTFSTDFRELVAKYDFSRFGIRGTVFNYGPKLENLIKINRGWPTPWWRDNKPPGELWICHTEAHTLTLSTTDGLIRVFEKSSYTWLGVVAENFTLLIRGLATIEISSGGNRLEDLPAGLVEDVGATDSRFWNKFSLKIA
jgi:hypothetical protein